MRAGPLLALLCLLGASAGCLNEFQEPARPHLVRIVALELSPVEVLAQAVLLNVTAVLDNRGGGDSEPIRLHAKAFSERTGFLLTERETEVGVLPGETTREVTLELRVPREGGVRVDVGLFEADLGRQTASITARNLEALEPGVLDTGLRISDVDFLVRGVTGGNRTGERATIQTDLYVTNEGDRPSEDLRVQVKAREISTRLVSDVAWAETGVIAAGATVIRSVNLTVPDGYNYVVEILTWRGEVIVDRSEGTVQLAPTFVKPPEHEVVTQDPNVRDFLTPTTAPTTPGGFQGGGREAGGGNYAAPAPEVPGFGASLALLAVPLAAFALVLFRRRAP